MIERADRRGKSTLSDAIQAWLRQSGLAGAAGERRVLSAWTREAGSIARRARAVRFERGVLTIEVSSSAQLHELSSFTGEGLRRAANRALGSDRIDRIAYKLKP